MPKNRYKINIDQVPLPFLNEQDKTYNMLDAKPLRVPQPSPGLDKQQATLQLCTRADGEQKWSHSYLQRKRVCGRWRERKIWQCISSKLPRWKTSTCSGSRAHLFQELGMAKKTKFYFASNKVKHSMKHAEIRFI